MPNKDSKLNPVLFAIEAAGGRRQLAKKLAPPVSRQAIEQWIRKGEIPPRRVPQVATATGIPKGVLNPMFKD